MSVKQFNYQNQPITFNIDGGQKMVNATEMAKAFGKRPNDFLSLPQTKRFIQILNTRFSGNKELIRTLKGRHLSGTWLHEKLALKFAAWLSPEFELWTFDRIEELLKTGVTTINNDDETILQAVAILQKRLAAQKEKVEYHDKVLTSTSKIPITVIAKDLGMTAIALNRKLCDLKIQYKSGSTYVPYKKYQNEGYTITETYTFKKRNGETGTSIHTYWTEKGRKFICGLFE